MDADCGKLMDTVGPEKIVLAKASDSLERRPLLENNHNSQSDPLRVPASPDAVKTHRHSSGWVCVETGADFPFHLRQHYARTNQTLVIFRHHFWILEGRSQVKRVIRECLICQCASARLVYLRMATLSRERVVQVPAFSHTKMNLIRLLFV
ncbi:hypothetical protein T4E_4879 [Trichinella pseudospiralis]|uniref:Integrase zinc-binding domain-containing protein n=1 Tax=Trichinella pseudospiralis TaxID=6337 RepID=A0A0V0XKT2_TRIPS|nr:hypothetical protein T4E_5904 [Trichinella pseudospiralis]KRX88604.1 hypothetical protein T4E_4879 [Trichinella pseudospiralis]KRY85613.1 hypothetical protein T4D_13284 [Trichinella pseudospiralis]